MILCDVSFAVIVESLDFKGVEVLLKQEGGEIVKGSSSPSFEFIGKLGGVNKSDLIE